MYFYTAVVLQLRAHLLILTQSGGTVDDSEFFTSIRNWGHMRKILTNQTNKTMCRFLLKYRPLLWLSLPPKLGHQSPPTCLSLWALKTPRQYLLSRDGRVVECGSLQPKSNIFSVVLNVIMDILDLLPSFLEHRELREVWKQLCLIPRPAQTHSPNVRAAAECVTPHSNASPEQQTKEDNF